MQVSPELAHLLGRHRIDPADIEYGDLIGAGSFGEVYAACLRGQVCAAKKLQPFEAEEDWFHFLREIATVAAVSHPAILRLVGFVPDANRPVIISEYLRNGTVDDLRKEKERRGRLNRSVTPGRFARIFYGVASALASLHRVGVLHRDVKPANIFLSAEWEPFLGDFGCARFRPQNWIMADHHPSLSNNIGTPLFRAPEILRGEGYDHKVDVYAFGLTLMILFAPEDDLRQLELEDGLKCTAETYARFFAEISEGVRFKRPESVPDPYWRIVEACLRPNPAERPEFTEVVAMMEDRAFVDHLKRNDRAVYLNYVEYVHIEGGGA